MADPKPDPIDAGIAALTAINPWFAVLGLVKAVGLEAVQHANENAKNKVDPTPEEIDKLLSKVRITGESLIPLRTE